MRHLAVALLCAGLAACAGAPRKSAPPPVATVAPSPAASSRCAGVAYSPAQEDPGKRGDYVAGGLFRPGERDSIPAAVPDVECIPEPQVVALERSKLGNRPVYTVLDREYRVLDDTRGFVEEGLASYYGQKFHGRRTSNWEVYDMYAFTAAHKTLPLPSFARVTNLENGRSVIVRVNDRGPFHDGRVLDLSFAAAVKLGVYPAGTGRVRVQALQPGDAAARPTFATQAGAPSSMDSLVSRLPAPRIASSAPSPGRAPAAEPSPPPHASPASGAAPLPAGGPVVHPPASIPGHRFDMRAGDAAGSAERFDAWMQERNVRVATGRPMPVEPPAVAVEALPAPATATAAAASAPPRPAQASGPSIAATVVLQVASFSTRDNADRALATLQRAGIAQARLLDALVGGQPIWRLRVGPLAADAEPDLVARLAGLGFSAPRRVVD